MATLKAVKGEPPGEQPADAALANRQALRPLGQAPRFAAEGDETIVSLVPRVLMPCGPSAITRLVRAVIVRVAVKLVLIGRRFAHVGGEGFKRFPPARTDRDPAPAVARIAAGAWVGAAPDHVPPRVVNARQRFAMLPVLSAHLCPKQLMEAAAACRVAAFMVVPKDPHGFAARAGAEVKPPHSLADLPFLGSASWREQFSPPRGIIRVPAFDVNRSVLIIWNGRQGARGPKGWRP